MYMHWMDWVIIGLVIAVVIAIVQFSKRYVSGVADFLSGNRLAGRYLLTVAGEMGSIGAIRLFTSG
jgi:SSS family solute:Na+ symporter